MGASGQTAIKCPTCQKDYDQQLIPGDKNTVILYQWRKGRQDDQWQDQGDAAHGKGEGADDGMKLPVFSRKKEEEGNLQGKKSPARAVTSSGA